MDLNVAAGQAEGMGPLACLLSAVAFGVMALFAKLAYHAGVGLDELLLVRFGLAGVLLLGVAQARGRLRGLGWRAVVTGLVMGGVGYAAQAGLYFAALTRVDASQVALAFSVYPLLVTVSAVLTRQDRPSRKRGAALVVALTGVVLVLGGASAGSFDALGSACALGSAIVYTIYILVGDRVAGADPLAFTALVCCGAFTTFATWSALHGLPDMRFAVTGWLWLVMIALVSTVAAILLFFTGLALVGPTVASLLSIIEPVVTVAGAALVFGESLSAQQAVGGAMVLSAVLIVQWPTRNRPPTDSVTAQDHQVVGAGTNGTTAGGIGHGERVTPEQSRPHGPGRTSGDRQVPVEPLTTDSRTSAISGRSGLRLKGGTGAGKGSPAARAQGKLMGRAATRMPRTDGPQRVRAGHPYHRLLQELCGTAGKVRMAKSTGTAAHSAAATSPPALRRAL